MAVGEPREVGREYLRLNFEHLERQARGAPARGGSVAEAWVEGEDGRRADAVLSGERLVLHAVVDVHDHVEVPRLHLFLETREGVRVFICGTHELGEPLEPLEPGERVHLRVSVENPLVAARYFVGCWLTRDPAATHTVFYDPHAADFRVTGEEGDYGIVALEHEISVERALERAPR